MARPPHLHEVGSEPPEEPGLLQYGGGRRNGNNLEGRVAALEAHMQHLATKADVQKLRTWVLAGVVGGMVIAAILTLAAARIILEVAGPVV